MHDSAPLSTLPNNEQYNLPEAARGMATRLGITFKEAHQFLDVFFTEEMPEALATGKAIIFHGFATIHVQEDREFSNPATPDPDDRIIKDKVCFHPHQLLEALVAEKKAKLAPPSI